MPREDRGLSVYLNSCVTAAEIGTHASSWETYPIPQGTGVDSEELVKTVDERSKWEIMTDEGEKILIRKNFISTQFTVLVHLSEKFHARINFQNQQKI